MDFQKLLQQAKAKQKVVEKKHVEDKVRKTEEKRKQDVLAAQKERESNEKLKRLKEAAEKRKLEYKGLHKPSRALPPPDSGHSSKSSVNSSKSSVISSKSSSTSSGHSSKPNSTTTSKSDGQRTKSGGKPTVHKATPKPPPPSNFNDLMKMAKEKKKSEYPPRTGDSPLGKSLLEKTAARNSKSQTPPVSRPPTAKKSPNPPSTKTPSTQHQPRTNGHASSLKTTRPQAHSSRDLPGASGLSKAELARRAALHKRKTQAAKPTAFYGSAASKILGIKSSESGFGGRYTSTWVDEMREEMEDFGDLEYSDEEDDLDGFVVDSDEEGGDEYSSHIRKIFGYDKRRFADEHYDDRIMESSFAQQEFEEQRSARIGRQEDIEDIQREQKEMARKRKRKPSPPRPYGASRGKLKQAKLSFR